jgi:hypothetical protein
MMNLIKLFKIITVVLFASVLFQSQCLTAALAESPQPIAADPLKILFIGNSYTYVNDMPQIFSALSVSGGKNVLVDQISFGGYTLEDHSIDTRTLDKIASDTWDYIVLQEQSQFPTIEYYRTNSMYPSARVLNSIIKTRGAETIFFMTWGRKYGGIQTIGAYSSPDFANFFAMQDSLRSAYVQIALELSALVAPVGRAWGLAFSRDATVDLWASDDSHPTLKGSYLAACVFYGVFFREDPTGLTYTAGLSTADALFFQQVAFETLTTRELYPLIGTLYFDFPKIEIYPSKP